MAVSLIYLEIRNQNRECHKKGESEFSPFYIF